MVLETPCVDFRSSRSALGLCLADIGCDFRKLLPFLSLCLLVCKMRMAIVLTCRSIERIKCDNIGQALNSSIKYLEKTHCTFAGVCVTGISYSAPQLQGCKPCRRDNRVGRPHGVWGNWLMLAKRFIKPLCTID